MLSCYRILDLTTEKAFMCGRALSDWGAEVIKIEPPGGDPARFRGLFPNDKVDPEKNLTWLAFNANKKSVTLDITSKAGKEIFKKLVKTADAVIESYAPGYLDSIGLGYKDLSAVNPGIVLTSISGFGQEGPYKDYKDPDIVVRALGGMVYTAGYDDRPPLTISYEHTHSARGDERRRRHDDCPHPARPHRQRPARRCHYPAGPGHRLLGGNRRTLRLVRSNSHPARSGAGIRHA